MDEIFSRNKLLYGEEYLEKLKEKTVAIFGLGGVGGWAVEALARAGISNFMLIDFDKVSISNINRQIIANTSTIGNFKTELFKERILSINPNAKCETFNSFYTNSLNEELFSKKIDFVIDAIDTMKSKIELLVYCKTNNIPVISSMGAGNRLDPTKLKICDIAEVNTTLCNFSKNIIRQLKMNNITEGITVVTSEEKPIKITKTLNISQVNNTEFKKLTVGSNPFVPSVAGLYIGYYVIEYLLE